MYTRRSLVGTNITSKGLLLCQDKPIKYSRKLPYQFYLNGSSCQKSRDHAIAALLQWFLNQAASSLGAWTSVVVYCAEVTRGRVRSTSSIEPCETKHRYRQESAIYFRYFLTRHEDIRTFSAHFITSLRLNITSILSIDWRMLWLAVNNRSRRCRRAKFNQSGYTSENWTPKLQHADS